MSMHLITKQIAFQHSLIFGGNVPESRKGRIYAAIYGMQLLHLAIAYKLMVKYNKEYFNKNGKSNN